MCNPAIKSQKDKKSWQKAKASFLKRILSAEKHDSNRKIIKVQQCAKKWSFTLRISSVSVTKSAWNCGFGHFTKKIVNGKLDFLVQCRMFFSSCQTSNISIKKLLKFSCQKKKRKKRKMTESFVCSYLNYCPLVCHFYKTKSLQKIENITKRVLTYFHHDFESDYSETPQKLNKTTMTTPPPDTGNKLNVHKMFKRRPGRLLNVLCTFNLCPVSRWSET